MSAKFIMVPGNIAVEKAVSSIGQAKRFVICGHPSGLNQFLTETFEIRRSAEEILEDAKALDASVMVQELKDYLAEEKKKYEQLGEGYSRLQDIEGSWETANSYGTYNLGFTAHLDQEEKPLDQVLMAEIQVENPWDVLAHFEYRVWYESLYLKEHCAMWRQWYEKYDAHVVSVTHEHLEAKVLRPPTTRKQAMELAWEHHYCSSDTTDCIADHAVSILGSDYWRFWWD